MKAKEINKKMKTQVLSCDRISTLPEKIFEKILTRMPIKDALRTSILQKKWRYSWRTIHKLVFTDDMVEVSSPHELKKYRLFSAIFHVLLSHTGPTKLEFNFMCSVGELKMQSEFDQIISYLSRGNNVKKLKLRFEYDVYELPAFFFSLQGLEQLYLKNCIFEPPLTSNGFSSMRSLTLYEVEVSAQMLRHFLSKCPLLKHIGLFGQQDVTEFASGVNKFTFIDLLHCVPLIQELSISKYYMKYLCAGGMPCKLPTLLAHLVYLSLEVCFMEHNEILCALCLIRSSPLLKDIYLCMNVDEKLPIQQTPTNFLDLKHYSDLKLDHLENLMIRAFRNLPIEMKFVKLIMAKSPMLEEVRIELLDDVSADEELMMLRDLVRFRRASPSAKVIIAPLELS